MGEILTKQEGRGRERKRGCKILETSGERLVEKRGVSRRGKKKKIIDWEPGNYKTRDCTLILLRNKRKGKKTKRTSIEK